MLTRETALATAAIYDSMFGAEDGTVPATFQVSITNFLHRVVSLEKQHTEGRSKFPVWEPPK